MAPSVISHRQFLLGILTVLLLTLTQTAQAQWWRFGADAGQPVFSDLLFNNVSALRVDRNLQFSPEDLDQRKVAVRGRAEVGQGKIGRIEASLDDGANWTPIPVGERGLFAFEFVPEIEHAYRFKIRALSTTGQSSDEAEHAFEFKVVREDNRALAKAAFQQLLDRYMARDRSGFMSLVSREFVGNETALDSALGNDFRFFDSIRIEPTIQRMAANDNRWTIYFNFRRQVRSVRSGQMLQDQALTSVTLIRDGDGYKLQELAAPLIFGVSDPSNVATFVAGESVGSMVISVDEDGTVSRKRQGQDVTPTGGSGGAATVRSGNFSLNLSQGFSLFSYSTVPTAGAFAFGLEQPGFSVEFMLGSEVSECEDLGVNTLNAITSAPAVLANNCPMNANDVVGKVLAVRLSDGSYALVRGISQTPRNFEYKHQRNGSPNF